MGAILGISYMLGSVSAPSADVEVTLMAQKKVNEAKLDV